MKTLSDHDAVTYFNFWGYFLAFEMAGAYHVYCVANSKGPAGLVLKSCQNRF